MWSVLPTAKQPGRPDSAAGAGKSRTRNPKASVAHTPGHLAIAARDAGDEKGDDSEPSNLRIFFKAIPKQGSFPTPGTVIPCQSGTSRLIPCPEFQPSSVSTTDTFVGKFLPFLTCPNKQGPNRGTNNCFQVESLLPFAQPNCANLDSQKGLPPVKLRQNQSPAHRSRPKANGQSPRRMCLKPPTIMELQRRALEDYHHLLTGLWEMESTSVIQQEPPKASHTYLNIYI